MAVVESQRSERLAWRVSLADLFAYTAAIGALCAIATGEGHRDERAIALAWGGAWLPAFAVQRARGHCAALAGTAAGAIAAAVMAFFRNETPLAIGWVAGVAVVAGSVSGGLFEAPSMFRWLIKLVRGFSGVRRRRFAGIALVALAGLTIWRGFFSDRGDDWPNCRTYALREAFPGFRIRSRDQVRPLGGSDRRPRAIGGLVISHDGTTLALEDPRSGAARLFDLRHGKWLPAASELQGRPLALSRDARLLAVFRGRQPKGEVCVVETASRKVVARTPFVIGRRLYGKVAAYCDFVDGDQTLSLAAIGDEGFAVYRLDLSTGALRMLPRVPDAAYRELAAATRDGELAIFNERDSPNVSLWNAITGQRIAVLPAARRFDGGENVAWKGVDQLIARQGDLVLHRSSFWRLDGPMNKPTSTALNDRVIGFAGERRIAVVTLARNDWTNWPNRCLEKYERLKRDNDFPFTSPRPIPERFTISLHDADRPRERPTVARLVSFVRASDRYDGRVDQWAVSGDGGTVVAIDALDRLFVWRLPAGNALE